MRKVGRMHLAAAAAVIAWAVTCAGTASAAPARAPRPAKTAETGADTEAKMPVDINAADSVKLATLPGIGPALAQRIVDYRKEHGPFKSVDELVNVRGVGERLLARLRDHIRIGPKE